MQDTVDILGILGSVLVGISFIPQTYLVIKKKEVKNISKWFILINIISSGLMIIYGIINLIIPMIIANSSVLLNNLIITYFFLKE